MVSKLYRLALKLSNPLLVPLENGRLARELKGNEVRFESRLENSIARGIEYFTSQEELESSSLYVFKRILNPSQGPAPDFVDRKFAEYREKWQNPNLRLIDPEYDPETEGAGRAHVWTAPHPLEAMMVRCAYADRNGLTEEFIDELASIDDNGGFGTTHVLLGAAILKEFSDLPKSRLNELITISCPKLVRAQATARAGNLFYERAAFLLWQGYGEHVDRVWIERIIRGQRKDGGWDTGRFWPSAPTKQHPSCLALAALVLYRDRSR